MVIDIQLSEFLVVGNMGSDKSLYGNLIDDNWL